MPRKLLLLLIIPLLLQLTGCTTTSPTKERDAATAEQRSVGTMLDDEFIELNASNAVYQDQRLNEQTHVNITSYNFITLITGEAPTQALKSQIETLVKSIPKVRRVHNMLKIAAPSSLLTRTSDATLTVRIKSAMLGERGFSHRIKVVTENGTTYLMGIVNRDQGNRAVAVAQGISGVQKIVKLFEYTD
ncbi:MAG: BON domain-containing protein [Gammaproteobacteria bacterium]|jgi:osmotically-inducible protein OsmY|nr:BON domain-containing protein [Gammaproteobacteria bacterium]